MRQGLSQVGLSFPWTGSLVVGVTLRRTRSTMSSRLSFTLLLQYSTIFCWYLDILFEASSLTSSKHLSPDASYSHLDRDHCLSDVNELEGGFSYWGSGCSSISPQDIGQFFGLGLFSIVQLGFDDLEQCPISHLHLLICLWMSYG